MFCWQGTMFSGLVCETCNSLWENPDDSFEAAVLANAKGSQQPKKTNGERAAILTYLRNELEGYQRYMDEREYVTGYSIGARDALQVAITEIDEGLHLRPSRVPDENRDG